ncbi:glycerophosphodiester phosphodiesterase family protein [Bradyrhizobium sp. BTAi1]|uniref:glycerophosphodiester phosphodiesterase family protein n=1 Tax=Bradyrhizobium sp. (strain BTAi1 / ATCC BAA-1182) TaxID=288000 RepID=UPI00005DF726|nr:glycerophosphodiester phosphodiesterase family protein [Bradyrhizobium sp. BTAi1]ABQ35821.1 putative glycerophosphoryl diester phosphodiesterase [Bradyrhizobium sp. BTAi1]
MSRFGKLSGLVLLICAGFMFVNNTNLWVAKRAGQPLLLAHRGLSQQFDRTGLTGDTCTAARMLPPTHDYLENTIASMRASFAAGADIVEFDVHPTTDGRFAVFHDWTLDCRTDGKGVTREHAMRELRRLDIGYGYTADGGRTFPFRGKGIGLMPSLDDVLATFPDRSFLINIKSNDPAEGRQLAAALAPIDAAQRGRLMVYGGDAPIAALRAAQPELRLMSRSMLKSCLLRYIGYGWTGLVPSACRTMMVLVPINVAPWLWGWPDRFLARMADAGSRVFVIGAYRGEAFSAGLDTPAEIARLPTAFGGGVMTDEIETVAPLLKRAPPGGASN